MAHTEHLPVYKSAYDLCLWLEQVVRANARRDKVPVLLELREEHRSRAVSMAVAPPESWSLRRPFMLPTVERAVCPLRE